MQVGVVGIGAVGIGAVGIGAVGTDRAVSFQPSPINFKQELVACHWHSAMTGL